MPAFPSKMTGSAPAAPNYYSIYTPSASPPSKTPAPRALAAAALLIVVAAALALLLATGAPGAPSALHSAAGDVVQDVGDFGGDIVVQHARNVRWVGRQLRGAWRESVGVVAAVGREARGAVRTVARAVDDATPSAVKKPLVAVPLAVGAGAYAVNQEWPQRALDVAADGVEHGARAALDAADYATDRMQAGIDYLAAHPRTTGAVVAAVAVPIILEAAGVIEVGDDLEAAADKVTGAAGRAARRVDAKAHTAVRKAQ